MNAGKKKNRDALRRLMGQFDVSADEVATLLDKKASTIHQYRSVGGLSINDKLLGDLREKLYRDYNNES